MRIEQMRAREPYEETLLTTLARGWSTQFGHPIRVSDHGAGQTWRLLPLLSAYASPPLTRQARRFLADTFRFTPHRKRAIPQFLAASAFTTNAALRWGTRAGFSVQPGLDQPQSKIVQPGNQRIRVFDFSTATTRVFLKDGFDATSMQREIAVRRESGPFLPILAADPAGAWLEEALVDAWSLPRCPPWIEQTSIRRTALSRLDTWLAQTSTVRDAREFVDERLATLVQLGQAVAARFPATPMTIAVSACQKLAREAACLGTVTEARSHGDFQPGNILVSRHRHRGERAVWIIDWEHCRGRHIDYDRFTLGLQTRTQKTLTETWRGFIDGSVAPLELSHIAHPSERRFALAMYVLEDVIFYLRESLSGPYGDVSHGLRRHIEAFKRGW